MLLCGTVHSVPHKATPGNLLGHLPIAVLIPGIVLLLLVVQSANEIFMYVGPMAWLVYWRLVDMSCGY